MGSREQGLVQTGQGQSSCVQGWFSSPVPLPCCSSVDNKLPQAFLQAARFCQHLRVHKALRKWSKEPLVTLLSVTISTLWSVQGVGFEVLAPPEATFTVSSTQRFPAAGQ